MGHHGLLVLNSFVMGWDLRWTFEVWLGDGWIGVMNFLLVPVLTSSRHDQQEPKLTCLFSPDWYSVGASE